MAEVRLVALDGTKMAANALMQANRTKENIDQEVEKIFAEAAAADGAEVKKLRGRKPKAPEDKAGHKEKKANTTDFEARVMSTSKGYLQGYNCQAVANEEQVIVAAEVTDEQNDSHQLHPMIDVTTAAVAAAGIAERPEQLVADAGHASEENFAALDEDDPDAYVATRNMKDNPAPRTGRRGPLRKDSTLVEQMDRKVSKKAERALCRRRQQPIEPVFGQIKDGRDIRGFMRRGKAACDSESKLICGTQNLLQLYRRARVEPSVTPFSRMAAWITC